MNSNTYMPTAANRAGVITSDQTRVYSVGGIVENLELTVQTWNDRKNLWEDSIGLTRKTQSLSDVIRHLEDFYTPDTHTIQIRIMRR
jgi:hypothetical protein